METSDKVRITSHFSPSHQPLVIHINCCEMLNAIQERKRCNRHVIIQWRNTIPFQELIGDHLGVDVKKNGDHVRGCTDLDL